MMDKVKFKDACQKVMKTFVVTHKEAILSVGFANGIAEDIARRKYSPHPPATGAEIGKAIRKVLEGIVRTDCEQDFILSADGYFDRMRDVLKIFNDKKVCITIAEVE